MRFLFLVYLMTLSMIVNADPIKLENISLKVADGGNSGFVNCAIDQVFAQGFPNYSFTTTSFSNIVENDSEEIPLFAVIRFIGSQKSNGRLQRFEITIESLDEEKGWELIQGANTVYPFTRKVWTIGSVKLIGSSDEPELIYLDACAEEFFHLDDSKNDNLEKVRIVV